MAVDDGVVELDARVEHPGRIAATLTVALADGFVEQRRILRRVDLHVLAAKAPELFDLTAREVHEVGEIRVASGVGRRRLVLVVVRGGLLGAHERHLDGAARPPRADR